MTRDEQLAILCFSGHRKKRYFRKSPAVRWKTHRRTKQFFYSQNTYQCASDDGSVAEITSRSSKIEHFFENAILVQFSFFWWKTGKIKHVAERGFLVELQAWLTFFVFVLLEDQRECKAVDTWRYKLHIAARPTNGFSTHTHVFFCTAENQTVRSSLQKVSFQLVFFWKKRAPARLPFP